MNHFILTFNLNQKPYVFKIRTNMDKNGIVTALESWVLRTKNYTVESFCGYINTKHAGMECHPDDFITEQTPTE